MIEKLGVGSKIIDKGFLSEKIYIKMAHGIFMLYDNGTLSNKLYTIRESYNDTYVNTIIDANGFELEYNDYVEVEEIE